MKNKIFEKDLYRYYAGKETLKQKILRPLELKYIYNMRCANMAKNKISRLYYKIKLKHLSKKTLIQIPDKTVIGEGFYIGILVVLLLIQMRYQGKYKYSHRCNNRTRKQR